MVRGGRVGKVGLCRVGLCRVELCRVGLRREGLCRVGWARKVGVYMIWVVWGIPWYG